MKTQAVQRRQQHRSHSCNETTLVCIVVVVTVCRLPVCCLIPYLCVHSKFMLAVLTMHVQLRFHVLAEAETKQQHQQQLQPQPSEILHDEEEVASLEDYFDFFNFALKRVLQWNTSSDSSGCSGSAFMDDDDEITHRVDVQTLVSRMQDFSMSTAYSGVGAPEATLLTLCHHLGKFYGSQVCPPQMIFQMEYDEACREELKLYDSTYANPPPKNAHVAQADSGACIFGDLNSFYHPQLQETIEYLKKRPDLALEILAKSVASGEACVTRGYCYKHNRTCPLNLSCKLKILCEKL